MIHKLFTAGLLGVFTFVFALGAGPAASLGQVIAPQVEVDGISVPSGTTLLNGSVLKTTRHEAAVHLGEGQIIQLHRNSSADFRKSSEQGVLVNVRAGTLSYMASNGSVVTMPPNTSVVFPPVGLPAAAPQQSGVRVVLVGPASAGQSIIRVNDATRIDPARLILLRSGTMEELHYVEAFDVNHVRLTANLQKAFPANTQVIQDAQSLESARAAGLVPVGVAAGASIAVAAGAAGGAAAGISTAAALGIIGGVAGGITAAAVAANSKTQEQRVPTLVNQPVPESEAGSN